MIILRKAYRLLGSRTLALLLFLATAVASVPGTVMEQPRYYGTFPFLFLPVLIGVTTAVCTFRNAGKIPVPVLLIHTGFVVTVIGFVVKSTGYVATANVYEMGSVAAAYRWDLDRDEPLGYRLSVEGIHREHHPAPVRVGVLLGNEKAALKEMRVGEDFLLPPYRVVVERLDAGRKNLVLTILRDGVACGTVSTSSDAGYPAGFPYRFRLVAYRDAPLKRLWVDVALYDGQRKIVEGTTEPNHPFSWNGETFYNTAIATDAAGRPYAGIQVVRDPGRPVVFSGLAIASLGALLLWGRKALWK